MQSINEVVSVASAIISFFERNPFFVIVQNPNVPASTRVAIESTYEWRYCFVFWLSLTLNKRSLKEDAATLTKHYHHSVCFHR
jgi:hypothetical protein